MGQGQRRGGGLHRSQAEALETLWHGQTAAVLQGLKLLWHVLVRIGEAGTRASTGGP
jgi:hypothetical protein